MVIYVINDFPCLSIVLSANQKLPRVRMFTGAEYYASTLAKVNNILDILLSETLVRWRVRCVDVVFFLNEIRNAEAMFLLLSPFPYSLFITIAYYYGATVDLSPAPRCLCLLSSYSSVRSSEQDFCFMEKVFLIVCSSCLWILKLIICESYHFSVIP